MRTRLASLALSLTLGLGFIGATAPVASAYAPWQCTMDATYHCTDYDATSHHDYVLTGYTYAAPVVTFSVTGPLDTFGYPYLYLVFSWSGSGNTGAGVGVQTLTGGYVCQDGGRTTTCSGTSRPLQIHKPHNTGAETLHIWGIRFSSGQGWTAQSTATVSMVSVTDHTTGLLVPNTSSNPEGDCAPFDTPNHYTASKVGAGGATYSGVYGSASVEDLHPCVVSDRGSLTMVLPANIQEQSFGGTGIVQLGYGEYSGDGTPIFLYTAADTGMVMEPVDWYNAPLVLGDLYWFGINQVLVDNVPYWSYCIVNLNTNDSGCTTKLATWTSGERAWWGYETKNVNDTLGVRYGDAPAYMEQMYYQDSQTGDWSWLTMPACVPTDAGLPYYHCTSDLIGSSISGYTTAN